MRTLPCGLESHASAYSHYLHAQAFRSPLADDLDELAAGGTAPAARVAWTLAATASAVRGAPAPALSEVSAVRFGDADALEMLIEARAGLAAEAREAPQAARGGGAAVDASCAFLSVCLSRGVAPASLAAASVADLADALEKGHGKRGGSAVRDATPADIDALFA